MRADCRALAVDEQGAGIVHMAGESLSPAFRGHRMKGMIVVGAAWLRQAQMICCAAMWKGGES